MTFRAALSENYRRVQPRRRYQVGVPLALLRRRGHEHRGRPQPPACGQGPGAVRGPRRRTARSARSSNRPPSDQRRRLSGIPRHRRWSGGGVHPRAQARRPARRAGPTPTRDL